TMPGINRLVPGGRKPVTFFYPFQKVELPLAFRGQHSIDWFKCIGCELCAKVCPNECIYFEFYEVEPTSEFLHPSRAQLDEMKKVIRRPAVDIGHCLFCGNCMEYCPTDAWNFTQEFELADYAREDLYYRADELRMPKENSDKEIVLINRIGEHPILEADVCIGCKKCERECPTRCIDMLDRPDRKRIVVWCTRPSLGPTHGSERPPKNKLCEGESHASIVARSSKPSSRPSSEIRSDRSFVSRMRSASISSRTGRSPGTTARATSRENSFPSRRTDWCVTSTRTRTTANRSSGERSLGRGLCSPTIGSLLKRTPRFL